ncbi:hypothetical protein E4P39_16030 [Blastococcus sp. CT_GayMR19]|uniref:hypothetical protein n=1 Tax=Blastococcus sp. CT_GayMR19 TaxID=2559608 RepID=UPI0010730681|nr:hypothetical protein [Blastococcus sp. CT_GayMR19]TFV72987.1 hypothetical protein E4P39_16030 [Blastococcus sp. CT_GayMR19]
MSRTPDEPKGERWLLLVTAADDEAARAGLDLATARTSLVEGQRQDLSSLGGSTPVPPALAHHTYGVATAALPWSDRARRALQPMTEGDPDALALTALLADEQGPARRLLEQAGLDTGAVLAAARIVAGSGGPHSVAGDDSRAWTSAHTSTVAVPRTDLWRVVSDPRRRVEWDDTVARVQVLDDWSFRTLDALSGAIAGPGRPVEDPGLVFTHIVTETAEAGWSSGRRGFPAARTPNGCASRSRTTELAVA